MFTPCHFRAADGTKQVIDLNQVTHVASGESYIHTGREARYIERYAS